MCVRRGRGAHVAEQGSGEGALLGMDRAALKELLVKALQQAGTLPLGPVTDGVAAGQVSLVPREDGLAAKDIPVDTLLHKVTMMRDKLRLAEQRINASDTLTAPQRLALQAQLTDAYRVLSGVAALLHAPLDGQGDTP